jgi:hypothetical protein
MDSDLFCEDYYTPPNENIVKLVTQLLAWRRMNITLYSNDVLNMLIDHNLATVHDVEKIMKDNENKTLDMSLPTCYIK